MILFSIQSQSALMIESRLLADLTLSLTSQVLVPDRIVRN
jgi:hypothetical protein